MKLQPLSPLEQDILNRLWPDKHLKVREIYVLLKRTRQVALTSIAVALDRLYSRGIVNRTIKTGRGGLRYVYFPRKTKKEVEKTVLESTVNTLIDTFGSTAVAYFNERFKER